MQDHQPNAFSANGLKKIQERIENLRVDLGASGALLLDESGQLLVECGRLRGFDLNTFLALLGNAMSATNAVVHLLKDEAAFDLHYHEGHNYEMYTTRLSDQIFLALMLDRGAGMTSRIGMMWLSLRRAVTDLRALLKSSMVETGAATNREIKNAISDTSPVAPLESLPPHPRKKLPGRAQSPVENEARPRKKLPGRDKPANPTAPTSSTPISPDVLNDPNHVLSYDEARALGLINLDQSEADV